MSELKTVKVGTLMPNPFRDGSGGTATWASVRESYPLNKKTLEALQASYLSVGVWEGIVARPASSGAGYQIAFGHHRTLAFQLLVDEGKIKDGIPIILKDLSDDEMLKYMAQENNEEYEHSFLHAVMNPIEAVVKAYGNGRVELGKPEGPKEHFRDAGHERFYTAATVARYLGWTHVEARTKSGIQPDHRVRTALTALGLIEQGILTRESFTGLTTTAAQTVVEAYRQKVKEKQEEIKAEVRVHEEAKALAVKQGDKNKADAEQRRIESKTAKLEKVAVSNAKNIAENVASQLKNPGTAINEVRRNVGLDKPKVEAPEQKEEQSATELKDNLIRLCDRLFLDNENWQKVLKSVRGTKADKELAEALDRVKARAAERAKEVKGRL